MILMKINLKCLTKRKKSKSLVSSQPPKTIWNFMLTLFLLVPTFKLKSLIWTQVKLIGQRPNNQWKDLQYWKSMIQTLFRNLNKKTWQTSRTLLGIESMIMRTWLWWKNAMINIHNNVNSKIIYRWKKFALFGHNISWIKKKL